MPAIHRVAAEPWSPWGPGARGLTIQRAQGCLVRLSDGRDYIDLVNGKGNVTLGHNHPAVEEAIIRQLRSHSGCATGWGAALPDLAEAICADVGGADTRIAFFSTGTEACRAAVTLARKATGRPLVLSAGYHGWDSMWEPASGLLEANADGVIDFFFVPELLERALEAHGNDVALVIMAPDYIHLRPETLRQVVTTSRSYGVLVCCDDVKQGYRSCPASALPGSTGQQADLYTFSKGLANGQRLSCVVGPEAIFGGARDFTYTAYFDGIPVVAAQATLAEMRRCDGHRTLVKRGNMLIARLREVIQATRAPGRIHGEGAAFQFVLPNDEIQQAFHEGAFESGILLFEGDNQSMSLAIDDAAIEDLVGRFRRVFAALATRFRGHPDDITPERMFSAAWTMIDGATDAVPYETALRSINRLMRWS